MRILLAILTLTYLTASAQTIRDTCSINGELINCRMGDPTGGTVYLLKNGKTVQKIKTDASGYFGFSGLTQDNYTVQWTSIFKKRLDTTIAATVNGDTLKLCTDKLGQSKSTFIDDLQGGETITIDYEHKGCCGGQEDRITITKTDSSYVLTHYTLSGLIDTVTKILTPTELTLVKTFLAELKFMNQNDKYTASDHYRVTYKNKTIKATDRTVKWSGWMVLHDRLFEKEIKLPFKDTTCVPNPDLLDSQQVYLIANKTAEFPGGQPAFMTYLQKNLRYPKEQEGWQGSIYVTFIVDTVGNIRNECIYKRYFKGEISPIEKVALSLIKEMPAWSPAEKNGEKVYMRITLPIKF